MERFREFLRKYLDSPFVAVFGALTIITTLWGVVSVYKDTSEWGGSRLGALILATLLGLPALFVFASYLIPSVRREYALPLNAKYIFTEINRTWEIDQAGNGVLGNDKTYLFFGEPQDTDLYDAVMSSHNVELEDLHYQSTDSAPRDYQQVSDTMKRIYWRPKVGELKVGTPYTHNLKSSFPYLDKDPPEFKIMTIVAPVFTLKFAVSVKSEIPIKQVVVFKERAFQKFKNVDRIARRGKSIKRRMAPLPSEVDANNLTWGVDKLPASTVYYMILYFNVSESPPEPGP
jgi:hypothetical protein